MLAKGNRSPAVREAPQIRRLLSRLDRRRRRDLAEHCIKKVETVVYPELGMERSGRSSGEFPAFIVIDDKGNDFFKN
jgi:fumarate hydratase class I